MWSPGKAAVIPRQHFFGESPWAVKGVEVVQRRYYQDARCRDIGMVVTDNIGAKTAGGRVFPHHRLALGIIILHLLTFDIRSRGQTP